MYKISWVLICTLYSLLLHGQGYITGKVTDTETNEALIGATISVENGVLGTVTDIDGTYRIQKPKNTARQIRVRVSYTGYKAKAVLMEDKPGDIIQDVNLTTDIHQLQDVVVSANKKVQTAQSVPMSISTLSPLQLRQSGANSFRDFASGIPNLSFDSQGAGLFGRFDNGISIRGVIGENTTAMYLDETPLPENIDPRLVDINRVEVLKGPQGTLYGSRNMGGAVKIITNQPNVNQKEGSIGLSGATVKEGAFDYGGEGILNVPIGKKIAFRAVGFYEFESGVFDRKINPNAHILNYVDPSMYSTPDAAPPENLIDGCPTCDLSDKENIDSEKNHGLQVSLGFYPTKNLSFIAKMITQKQTGDGYDFAEGKVGNFDQIRISGVPEYFEDNWKHYSFNGVWTFKKGKLISNTSYTDRLLFEQDDDGESFNRSFEVYDGEDQLDFFAGSIYKNNVSTQLNQELRFASSLGGKIDFTIGAFYMHLKEKENWLSRSIGAAPYISLNIYEDPEFAEEVSSPEPDFYDFGGKYGNKEFAFFGEVYISITKQLKATLGLRYFDAKLSIDSYETGFIVDTEYFEVIGAVNEKGINPKFGLTYRIDKDVLFYANVARGFRLGDLNEIVPDIYCAEELVDLPDGQHPRIYESDYLWNYELGFKGTWANGRLMTNAAIFYNDWKNLQQNRNLECGYNFTSNVGSAHTLGLELEVRGKVIRQIEVGMGVGLLDAVIEEGGPSLEAEAGDKMLFTPNFTGNINAKYTGQFNEKSNWYIRADYQYVGERLNTFSPEDPEEAFRIFEAYGLLNTRVGVQFPNYEFAFFITNHTNKAANFGEIFSVAVDIPGRPRFATNRPRTIGMQARYYF